MGNISDQQEFTQIYNAVGDPGAVFNTGSYVSSPGNSSSTFNILSGVTEPYNLSSAVLQALSKTSYCYINEQVTVTLVLSCVTTLPEFDLSADLILMVNGVMTPYTYIAPWANNIATISFRAPSVVGPITLTFKTSYSVKTSTAVVNLSVIPQVSSDLALIPSVVPQTESTQDVTIVNIYAKTKISGLPAKQFGRNVTLTTTQLLNQITPIQDNVQEFRLVGPEPPGLSTIANPWFSFTLDASCQDFSGISAEILFKDASGDTQWSMPIVLPLEPGSNISLKFPLPNWDDSYTFILALIEDTGWQVGTWGLNWTHSTGSHPVTINRFAVSAADPSYQPVVFQNNDTGASLKTLFPIVWVNGSTSLVFWSDESIS